MCNTSKVKGLITKIENKSRLGYKFFEKGCCRKVKGIDYFKMDL